MNRKKFLKIADFFSDREKILPDGSIKKLPMKVKNAYFVPLSQKTTIYITTAPVNCQ